MSIDFSKAPEGATHYLVGASGFAWFKIDAGRVLVFSSADGWCRSWRKPDELTLIPTFEPFVSVEDAQPTDSKHDAVNNPSHYASGSVECIEAIKASMSHEAFLGYLKGNVQKYIWRYEKKSNPVEDLKKAQWYLARLTEEQEG
jgi:Protein of unknwon function (DUF3310)